ncbi:hypothetical protein [Catenulispora subtropica]|uniref:Glycosyl transferase n=1 Tax=Catenulispora subtropica TaxID=450798 RepID=A0ABP5D8F2_9ACTN
MTESPSGQGAPDHEVEAALLTESSTPPAAVPEQAARAARTDTGDVETVDPAEAEVEVEVEEQYEEYEDYPPALPYEDSEGEDGDADRRPRSRNPFRRVGERIIDEILDPSPGLFLSLVYILVAVVLTWKLLLHPMTGLLRGNPYDQLYFEWQLTAVQHAVLHFQNPLFTHAMNAPDGMNMAANPQSIGPAVVLTPVTYLFGSSVSFALLLVGNLAATAIAWRWFLRKHAARTETAAFVGGLFMGFSPSMMSHSLGHPNLSAQYLVPLILDRMLRLRDREHTVRHGVLLGLLITAQVFVGEEVLFLTALGCAFFLVSYAVMRPRQSLADGPAFLKGSAVAVATAAVLLAYPLTFQFIGPMSFKGIPFGPDYFASDLKSYLVYPSLELWGDPDTVDPLARGATEQQALVGWALVLVVTALALWCFRSAAARALVVTGLVMVVLSLGTTPQYDAKPLTWWGLGPEGVWTHLKDLPLFSSSLPMRSALAVSWVIGILLTLGVDKAMEHRLLWLRGVVAGAVATALVPLIPRVFDVIDRAPIPNYFTAGTWKECVSPGHNTIVGVPLSANGDRTEQTWSTAADTAFDIPQGPAFVPDSPTNKHVVFGKENVLWTAQWLTYIYNNGGGATPQVDKSIRDIVAQNLATWRAKCVVAADDLRNLDAVKSFLDQAIAPGVHKGGVVVWKEPTG